MELLSLTRSLDSLRQSIPNLNPTTALNRLKECHTPAALLYLYQEFFPQDWEQSTASVLPQGPGLHSPRELEFINHVDANLFPLCECELELALSQEEYLHRIPVPALGIDWAFWLSNDGICFDELEISLQLLLPLTDCGRYAIECLGAEEYYQEVWDIDVSKLPTRPQIHEERLKNWCSNGSTFTPLELGIEVSEPPVYLVETLDLLDYHTGNPILDLSHENPEEKWLDWNPENIRTLTLAYKEVPPYQERVSTLLDWLESSPDNFNEILKQWNNNLVQKS